MFDRCWRWRRKLQRRADGTLPARQCGALDDHLSQCARCQAIAEAERALCEALHTHTGLLETHVAEAFDNRVVARLLRERGAPARTPLHRVFPLGFLSQIAVGACGAAVVTALCLASALHPGAARAEWRPQAAAIEPSLPPVPLESLLQAASPCAALLWAAPHTHGAGAHSAPRTDAPRPLASQGMRPRQETPSVHDNMG